jgi:hypothetical protein
MAQPPTMPRQPQEKNAFDDALDSARNDWKTNGNKLGTSADGRCDAGGGGDAGTGSAASAPRWVPDADVANCMACSVVFDWITRKVRTTEQSQVCRARERERERERAIISPPQNTSFLPHTHTHNNTTIQQYNNTTTTQQLSHTPNQSLSTTAAIAEQSSAGTAP